MAEPVRVAGPRGPDTPAPPSPAAGASVPPAPAPAPPDAAAPIDRWNELTSLLVGPERQRLDHVEHKVDSPAFGLEAVTRVLPEAVARRAKDRALGDALGPVVGEAIKASVRRDPQPVVDAIFPVIGPAIRRAISAAFAELVQSINTTLEHSVSLRGLAWRVEAVRTGRSFGEVVLSHSLLFRVEQLFLVHRDTGLLVSHLTSAGVKALSPEMVAGMLTAITDFARDSFQVSRDEGLDSFALGDFTVLVEQGPAATLAAVIRGHAPVAYRAVMQQAVEQVQAIHAGDLEAFGRDGVPFEVRPDLLEPCLVSQLAEPSRAAGRWRLALIGAVILGAVGWCAVPRVLEARRFGQAVADLRREPGVVVGSTARDAGRWVITGLRDPLARDPATVLRARGLDSARVEAHWEPYVALRPEFVLRRAGRALQPPATAHLTMRRDTLAVDGVASAAWRAGMTRLALAIPGVGAVDTATLRDSAEVALRERADGLERVAVSFARGEEYPDPESRATVDSMSTTLLAILGGAAAAQRAVAVEVRATTDSVGSEAANAWLRLARAQALRSMLVRRGVPAAAIVASPDSTPGNRSASLRIVLHSLPPASP